MVEPSVKNLFDRYEQLFNQSLAGAEDMDAVASLYASEFIGASPAGVRAAKNDDELKRVMAHGHGYYRQIGTKEMRIRDIRIAPIDDHHCVAHVAWTATYARDDLPETKIDFDVHYFVQTLDAESKVFGWVTGDEQALLKERGIT